MATFLIAWELGMGAGHCINLLPVAKGLCDRGHKVYVAPRDLTAARRVFRGLPINYLAAAYACSLTAEAVAMPRTFTHILHNTGFCDQESLDTFVSAWRNLSEFVRPDAVICEHAPTALLASHMLGIPRAILGTGFFSPPDVSPLPDLRDWLPPQNDEFIRCEMAVLERINLVLKAADKPAVPRLSALYSQADENFLLTFAELDHYSGRTEAEYWGMWSPDSGATPSWPSASGQRVFAYLKAPQPNWRPGEILTMLRQAPVCALVVVAGANQQWLRQFEAPNLLLRSDPVDIRMIAKQCDFAILNGNAGTATELLLHGVPQLHIPIFLEQSVFSRRVVSLGAGQMAETHQLDLIAAGLEALRTSSRFRGAANQFARKYERFDADESMKSIVRRVENLAKN